MQKTITLVITVLENNHFIYAYPQKLSKDDILWHYFKTPSIIHMHKFLMYDDLMAKYQHLKEELIKYQHINEELEGF